MPPFKANISTPVYWWVPWDSYSLDWLDKKTVREHHLQMLDPSSRLQLRLGLWERRRIDHLHRYHTIRISPLVPFFKMGIYYPVHLTETGYWDLRWDALFLEALPKVLKICSGCHNYKKIIMARRSHLIFIRAKKQLSTYESFAAFLTAAANFPVITTPFSLIPNIPSIVYTEMFINRNTEMKKHSAEALP